MSRSRIVSLIVILVLANYLVFSNLIMLLFTAGNEAATRATTLSTPRATRTAIPMPPEATETREAVPTPTDTPMPTATLVPTPLSPATATPPAATPTLNRALIPTYAPVAPGAPLKFPFRYVIKQGDTLSGLADRFLVPQAKIMAANNISNPNFIRVGQELIIPDPNQ